MTPEKEKAALLGSESGGNNISLQDTALPVKSQGACVLNSNKIYSEPTPRQELFEISSILKGFILNELTNKNCSKEQARDSIRAHIVLTLEGVGAFFYHRDFKTHLTSMFFNSYSKELLLIGSNKFQSWLAEFTAINRTHPLFKYCFSAIEDHILNNGKSIIPERFWAARQGSVYLSNGNGQLVRILAGKYELLDNGSDNILFESGFTLSEWKLTEPRDPFITCSLFSKANFAQDTGLDLLRLWAFSLPTNQRCKPPLVFTGDVGSGKTRVAVGIFELYGLFPHVVKVLETGESDFWTSLDTGGLVCFDNADNHIKWLPDALAAAATGVGQSKRKLYTDNTNVHLKPNAWPVITSSNPLFASDAGLADRLLVIRMNRRLEDTAEAELSKEIALNRDSGLSFICETLSQALADTADTPKNLNKRHPDFASFAVKLGRALNRGVESIHALQAAEIDKSKFNLENDDLGAAILQLMGHENSFEGTTAELLQKIKIMDPDFNLDYWKPKRTGKRLSKIWPHLSELFKCCRIEGHDNNQISISVRQSVLSVFQRPFSGKPREKSLLRDFTQNSLYNTE